MGDERASLEISVRDPRTAEVRVVAPDRPALMRDIARALTKEGFFIDSATISTKDGDVADNVFVIKLNSDDDVDMTSFVDEKGFACQTMLGRVETLVVEAAMDAWGISTPDTVAYLAPEDRKVEASATATTVQSSLTKSGKCVMVSVTATDRAGLLAATTAALHDIGCGIISATVQTKEGIACNNFVVAAPDGCGAEKVRLACLAVAAK
jgi:UTP:GlnB (protein PII) uridylyltransferase